MASNEEIRVEDIMPVRSRIAWGAILGGAVITMSIMLVLGLLGTVIGLSIGSEMTAENLSIGAAIWVIVTSILALFVGGYVATRCAAGENRPEAVVHGLATWGVVTTLSLMIVGLGVGGGLVGIAGLAGASQSGLQLDPADDWTVAARRAGVPQERIDEWRQQAAPENRAGVAQDPAVREQARQASMRVSGWALGATLLGMVAAIGGALVGSGPTLELWRHGLFVSTTTGRRERELTKV